MLHQRNTRVFPIAIMMRFPHNTSIATHQPNEVQRCNPNFSPRSPSCQTPRWRHTRTAGAFTSLSNFPTASALEASGWTARTPCNTCRTTCSHAKLPNPQPPQRGPNAGPFLRAPAPHTPYRADASAPQNTPENPLRAGACPTPWGVGAMHAPLCACSAPAVRSHSKRTASAHPTSRIRTALPHRRGP